MVIVANAEDGAKLWAGLLEALNGLAGGCRSDKSAEHD